MLLSPFIPLTPSATVHSYLLKKLQIVKCLIKVIHIVTVSCIIHFFCKYRLLSGILFLLSEELPLMFLVVQICVAPLPRLFFFLPEKVFFNLHVIKVFFVGFFVGGFLPTPIIKVLLHGFGACIASNEESAITSTPHLCLLCYPFHGF